MSSAETGLGATIRAWRDRLTPAEAGLPTRRARRTTGLRREELSELAGISVDYIVRLEQGRTATPSAQVVAALARARLWYEGAVGGHAEDRKIILHPEVGEITVDCDILHDSDTDLKIVIYTTTLGSEDESKLDLTRVALPRAAR